MPSSRRLVTSGSPLEPEIGFSRAVPLTVTAISVPLAQLIVALVVGICAGILAVLRPARRAGRLDVLAAMQNE